MRPDRIIVGEVRGAETLDMLQAMNTGHDGSLTTVHANSARDALHRLEMLVLIGGIELPVKAIREQIAGGSTSSCTSPGWWTARVASFRSRRSQAWKAMSSRSGPLRRSRSRVAGRLGHDAARAARVDASAARLPAEVEGERRGVARDRVDRGTMTRGAVLLSVAVFLALPAFQRRRLGEDSPCRIQALPEGTRHVVLPKGQSQPVREWARSRLCQRAAARRGGCVDAGRGQLCLDAWRPTPRGQAGDGRSSSGVNAVRARLG